VIPPVFAGKDCALFTQRVFSPFKQNKPFKHFESLLDRDAAETGFQPDKWTKVMCAGKALSD